MSKVVRGGVLYINGLPAAHSGPGGHACAPEECWVTLAGKKVKKSFSNTAYANDLTGTTGRIFYKGYPLATMISLASKSYGDAGSEGGVISGTKLDKAEFLSASPNVTLEGNKAIRHGDKIILNAGNSEITTWNQPSTGNPVTSSLQSDPIEQLEHPASLNIQLIRNPAYEFKPASVQQSFSVQHSETHHTVNNTYGVFKNIDNTFLWHADTFREGLYTVEEFYLYGNGMARIPLGHIHTQPKNDTSPAMKLVPLAFRRYDDIQHSAEGSGALYPESFIYLFKDGYIWRVFHVNKHGRLYEIDFYKSNKSIRPDTGGELKQGVLLPIQDANGKHTFSVAVSHLALSWDTLHQLGGIDPTDPRFEPQHHLPIPPDPEFIAKRLQKIDIAALIEQGEQTEVIPPCNTQDEVMYSAHSCEPPTTNMYWVVERDRLKHSTGTKKFSNHLFWDQAPEPAILHTPTLTNLAAQALECHVLPGTAVLLLDDPLGRLLNTAEMMLNQHAEFQAYSDEHGEAYTLGQVVGAMLGKMDAEGKDYRKHVRDDERKKHIRDYDLKKEAYLLFMRESIELLKFWYPASYDRGQWEDFYRIPRTPDQIRKDGNTFRNYTNTIHSAFMLHEEGMKFLAGEAVVEKNNTIAQTVKFVESISRVHIISTLVDQTAALLSGILEPTTESFNKIVDIYQKSLGMDFKVKLIGFPIVELIEHHHVSTGKSHTDPSSTIKINNGRVTKLPNLPRQELNTKILIIITVDEMPAYEWFAAVSDSQTPIHPSRLEKARGFFKKVESSKTLRGVLSTLAIFNGRLMQKQLKEAIAFGEITNSLYNMMTLEIMRNYALPFELMLNGYIMTKQMANGNVSALANRIAGALTISIIVAGLLIDAHYAYEYFKKGEYILSISHVTGMLSGFLLLMGIRSARLGLSIARLFGIVGIALGLLSMVAIYFFTKNIIEKWLHDGYWGHTDGEQDSIRLSMEKFFFFTRSPTALQDIIPLDGGGKAFIPFEYLNDISVSQTALPNPGRTQSLAFKFHSHIESESYVNLYFYITTPHGMRMIQDHELDYSNAQISEAGMTWNIILPRRTFPLIGNFGKIILECHDPRSETLLGKETYIIRYDTALDFCTFEKVPNEFKR